MTSNSESVSVSPSPKKRKFSGEVENAKISSDAVQIMEVPLKESDDALKHLGEMKVSRVLRKDLRSKTLFLLASVDKQNNVEPPAQAEAGGDGDTAKNANAVVLLEKTAFSEDSLPCLFSPDAALERSMQNDIYGVYECFPSKQFAGFKTTVIYPATEKHIQKYSAQELHIITETYQDYENITLPYIEKKQLGIQWVFNILDKKAESERIIFEDPDPDTGFVMLPDMKWDEKQVANLYLIVIVHPRGIRSIRDLNDTHLPLLRNIRDKCTKCITEKYQISADQLRAYVHYQPSYYHFHVHFTHLMFDAPGTNIGRAHLLSDVIENIELQPTYYQKKALSFVLSESDELYKKFQEARTSKDETEAAE